MPFQHEVPMKLFSALLLALLIALLAGCGSQSDPHAAVPKAKEAAAGKTEDAEVRANLAKLSPDDRKLAEAQKYCAVDNENLLGSMDVPVKVMVKEQPVFLCCKGCKKRALADPDKTIARVDELKARSAEPPSK